MSDTPYKCFVISPIGEPKSAIRKHADLTLNNFIRPGVTQSGIPITVTRADEDPRAGIITNHIITDIKQADLIIADLTTLNANVFYELGVADSAQKPVIQLALTETKIPFDKSPHSTFFFDPGDWDSQVETQAKIARAIKEIFSPTYKVSNPVTNAGLWASAQQSDDPTQQLLAQLSDRLSMLETIVVPVDPYAFGSLAPPLPVGNYGLTGKGLYGLIMEPPPPNPTGGPLAQAARELANQDAAAKAVALAKEILRDKQNPKPPEEK